MRSIIEDNDLHVMATVARYVCSYAMETIGSGDQALTT